MKINLKLLTFLSLAFTASVFAEERNFTTNFDWKAINSSNADVVNFRPVSTTSTMKVTIKEVVYAKELNMFVNPTNVASMIGVYNDAYIDVGDVSGVGGGNINSYKAGGTTLGGPDTFTLVNTLSTTPLETIFTNAKNVTSKYLLIGQNEGWGAGKGSVIWNYNIAGGVYNFNNSIGVGMAGAKDSKIVHTKGWLGADRLFMGGNGWVAGGTYGGSYVLNGGILAANIISLGNVDETNKPTMANALIEFRSGEMKSYALNGTIRITDHMKDTAKVKFENLTDFKFLFSDSLDVNGHSANVLSDHVSATASITFGSISGMKGGFTVKNTKTFTNSSANVSGVTGKISLLDGSKLVISSKAKLFTGASEIFISKNGEYDFSAVEAAEKVLVASQIISGSGSVIANTGSNISDIESAGAIFNPTSDTAGAAKLTLKNMNLAMYANTEFRIDIFGTSSADVTYDQVEILTGDFYVMENGTKLVFDLGMLNTSAIISLADVLKGSGSLDFSVFTFEFKNAENFETPFLDAGNLNLNYIPEPSDFAVIFGLFAVAFAIYKRKH